MSGNFYYFFCNHWTQGGIGFAFPMGWYNGKKYEKTFSTSYTIHKMLDSADMYPGLIASLELDAYAYEEVEKEDPQCIVRLKKYLSEGRASIEGGTYGQPFGQDYGWEPNIRQLRYGREVIQKVLDYNVDAFLVEEQWYHPQMPQLLRKSGFKYASLQNQNSGQVMPLNEALIDWEGIDGTVIPAIPANDLMVSCVRQYTGYDEYQKRLEEYERPLLFQWVEIWPPGMDWGASAVPFEKAIHQVRKWGGQCTSLAGYFEKELPNRDLKKYYLPLDQSNYKNNWYQGGGWGYDGDRVIISDQMAEHSLLKVETLAAMLGLLEEKENSQVHAELMVLWKTLLILQNHDFSVARSYRAITEDGLVTNAGSYGVVKYEALISQAQKLFTEILTSSKDNALLNNELCFFNYTGISHKRTVSFEIENQNGDNLCLYQSGQRIPHCITSQEEGKVTGLAMIELPELGIATVNIIKEEASSTPYDIQPIIGESSIEDGDYLLRWISGSWGIEITNKQTRETVEFKAFTGPIGKQNEHGGPFPSLSPAHEIFTFAFDGKTHCPDQISQSRIKAKVEASNSIKSTLLLHCDLLTLHTSNTPVAFAQSRVILDHQTGKIECESYLYTGVPLALQCHAVFKHGLASAKYTRDFPFGEEETSIDDIYANSYLRVTNGKGDKGFTLIHPGVQKIELSRSQNGGKVKHLLARDQINGEYKWTFSLYFGKHSSSDSARLSKQSRATIEAWKTNLLPKNTLISMTDKNLLMTAFYQEKDRFTVRIINYSENITSGYIKFAALLSEVFLTDFTGTEVDQRHVSVEKLKDSSNIELSFEPWEIITIQFKK
ncbi:hypothetical protein [Fictibacillus fluitans]|uniref:Glycoside hydrolase family 38 N-terminal domain-containing protein n=1 Tax=Fictibacillus fluitans TaxID=3058422 RepID=A0ABT8I344_9BACL|nr:hypothetical protein [Fictibacillus sp. NE201]MDN4527406.1 hypothetical protein [Fictibacillus sp. NE201]